MNRLIGILLIAVSAAAFGTLAIFGRYAYRRRANIGGCNFAGTRRIASI